MTGTARVLRWGKPHVQLMRCAFLALHALDGFSDTGGHAAGRLPVIITAAGFANVALECQMPSRLAPGAAQLETTPQRGTG